MAARKIPIDIKHCVIRYNYYCNLGCNNCAALSSQAPSKEIISVEMVDRFIEESKAIDYRWHRIGITGGEPTYHPQFIEITKKLADYAKSVDASIYLNTNGYTKFSRQKAREVKAFGVRIRNTKKKDPSPVFTAMNVAPIDYNPKPRLKCNLPQSCGMVYTASGYFGCCCASAIARVLGIQSDVQSVGDIDLQILNKDFPRYCPLCGCNMGVPKTQTQIISPTWVKILLAYRKNDQVTLERYRNLALNNWGIIR